MKKTYIVPQTEAIALDTTTSILGASTMTFGDSSKEVDTSGGGGENDEGVQLGRDNHFSNPNLWDSQW